MDGTICQMCGDVGAQNALVFCVRCLDYGIHRYCLPVMPKTLTEFVRWYCHDCEERLSSVPSAIRGNTALEEAPSGAIEANRNRNSTNESSQLKPSLDIASGKEEHSIVKASDEERHRNTLGPCGFNSEQSQPDEVHDSPLLRKKTKKSKKTRSKKKKLVTPLDVVTKPVDEKGQTIPFKKASEEDDGNLVSEGAKVDKAAADMTSLGLDPPIVPVGLLSVPERPLNIVSEPEEQIGKNIPAVECGEKNKDKLCKFAADVARVSGSPARSISTPKDINPDCAQPLIDQIWSGNFDIGTDDYGLCDGLVAHLSSKACLQVQEEAKLLSKSLSMELVPKASVWPKSFQISEPSDDNIGLYFFALGKSCIKDFDDLVCEMMIKGLALRAVVTNAELLIFTSYELPYLYWKFKGKFYLWGVFKSKKPAPSLSDSAQNQLTVQPVEKDEANLTNNRTDDRSPISPLSNIGGPGLRWMPPCTDEVKLNVDAVVTPDTGLGAIGGLIRDKNGMWVHGFYMYLGQFDPLTAQFFAIFKGLKIALRLGIHKLIIESNSEEAVEAIASADLNHLQYNYIEVIRGLMDKCLCQIKWICNQTKTCANRLTQEAFNSRTLRELPSPPQFMLTLLSSDLQIERDG